MEKIQQALERARQQRQEAGDATSDNAADAGDSQDVQSIQYTRTQSLSAHSDLQRENRLISAMDEQNQYLESFKILSTQVIQRMDENHWKSLAVTSVSPDEGKTTTAINLGLSIAKEIEYTVLLVDTNLRHPEIHRYFGMEPTRGLSDYLTGDIDLADILIRPDNINHFVILPGGAPILNSTEMLGSPKMCDLVNELKERYPKRVVIFDLPPVLNTADTLSFIPCIDSSLIVVEDDVTREQDLKQAIEMMSVTNILGTVLNKSRY